MSFDVIKADHLLELKPGYAMPPVYDATPVVGST